MSQLVLPFYTEQSRKAAVLLSSAYHYNYAAFNQIVNEDTTLFFENASSVQPELMVSDGIMDLYGFTSCNMPYLSALCEEPMTSVMQGALELWLGSHAEDPKTDPYTLWNAYDTVFLTREDDAYSAFRSHIEHILTSKDADAGRELLRKFYLDMYRGNVWGPDDYEWNLAQMENKT